MTSVPSPSHALTTTAVPGPAGHAGGSGAVRVTMRATAGHFHKEIDVSLPAVASLDEVLGEVTDLMNAPIISKPWRATTAAGRPLDHAGPIGATGLADGALVLLRPHSPAPPPVIRDAAEALAQSADHAPRGLATAWSVLGILALGGALGSVVSWPAGLAGVALLAVALHLWARNAMALAPLSVIAAALAAGLGIGDVALGLIGAALTALALVGLLHAVRLGSALLAGTTGNAAVAALAAGCGLFLPGLDDRLLAGAAAGLAAVLVIIATSPGLSTQLAGIRVPHLPTAGEDLAVADGESLGADADADARARRARALYDGTLLGCALAACPALAMLALGTTARGAALAACVVLAGAVLLHAARHMTALSGWSLMAVAGAACAAAATIAVRDAVAPHPQWALSVIAGILILAATTACLWARFVPRLEPTTLQWLERAEAVCLALYFPLACYLAGIFALIRGIGA